MRLSVKGIGVSGGFGCGVAELAIALKSGAAKMAGLTVPSAQGPLELPAFRAETERLEEFVPKRTLRRIDRYSKMGLLGSYLALQDAGMLGSDLSRVGVVIASGYGATDTTFAFLDSIISDGDICASPTHFAHSVHNSAAANISIMLGAKGPSLTVSQFDMSVPSALLTARQWLAERRVDAVLFGALDEVSDLIGYVWHRQRAHAHEAIAPLNFEEESSIIGEGAAFLVLTRDDGGEAYCAIDDVVMGSSYEGGTLPLPGAETLLILGADGRKELGMRYRDLVPAQSAVASYATLYGSMPAAPGFDLACAAQLLKEGVSERVAAVKLAEANEYAVVTLSKL